jgi:hypothetical protein
MQVLHKFEKLVSGPLNFELTRFSCVRFQVLTVASMMFRAVFWVILPCKMIVDRRFRGEYCLHPVLNLDA